MVVTAYLCNTLISLQLQMHVNRTLTIRRDNAQDSLNAAWILYILGFLLVIIINHLKKQLKSF